MSSELPEGWRLSRLGDECDLLAGFAFKSRDFTEDPTDIRLLRGDNVGQGFLRWSSAKRLPPGHSDAAPRYELHEGDVILAMDRPWIDAGLKWAIVRADDLPSLLVQRVLRIRGNGRVHQGFLPAVVADPRFTTYVKQIQTGTAVPHISARQVADYPIAVPPVDEQRLIAAVLGSIDDKIASNRRLGRVAEEALAHCCTRVARIDPAPGPGWAAVPFLEAVEINPRVRIAKGTDTPFIAMADVPAFGTRPDTIGRRPYSGGCKYEPGDTLMARITGCIEHGKGAFIDFVDEPGAGSTEFLVFRARDPLTPEAVFCLSRDQRLRSHAIASMTGTSGRQRVDNACFEALTVSIAPDSREREAAVAFMRRAMEVSKVAWAEARTLSSIRDALLPKLVSGKIRIPVDLDQIVATKSENAVLLEATA